MDLKNIKKIPKDTNKPHTCPYCNQGFVRLTTLSTHLCEQKRRHQSKNDRHVKYALKAFIRYHELVEHSNKNWDDFVTSIYYSAFVRFGSLVSNVNPVNPNQFIDYMVNSRIKIDNWNKECHYYKFVENLVKREPLQNALERAIETMTKWGEISGKSWNEYFVEASKSTILYDIKDGKISPWIVFNSEKAKQRLTTFSDSELEDLDKILNVNHWYRVFSTKKTDLEFVKTIIEGSNI